MAATGPVSLKLPGFGLPIDFALNRAASSPFLHGINNFLGERLTRREVAMLHFMDTITDKPDWHMKVFDENVVKKWREEAAALPDGLMSDMAFEWCITELRDRAKDFEMDGFVRTLETGSRCIKSDGTIPTELRDELRRAVEPLLGVDDKERDWDPNSNDQVLNLVDPSIYPLVYGRTRVLPTGQVGLLDCMDSYGKGDVANPDQEVGRRGSADSYQTITHEQLWSKRFQWLPAEVKFQGDTGTHVKITSYINNLRPSLHRDLYNVVEKFISNVIPLWNEVLVQDCGRAGVRIRPCSAKSEPERIPDWAYSRGLSREELMSKTKEYLALPDNPAFWPQKEDVDLPDDWETNRDWDTRRVIGWKFNRIRKVVHPEPGDAFSYEEWKDDCMGLEYSVKLQDEFRLQGLQIIVKLSSIELTPEKPSYPGGDWHLPGMLNEHIVATAIYYYDVDNVTPSRLRFRQEAVLNEMDVEYDQDDHRPFADIFGINSFRNEPAVQEIGSIATCADRLLVFPNTLQHKIEPVSLLDPTRHGHCRFLVLWLVDPHYQVVSTANVPPQQPDWWLGDTMSTGWNRKLPKELSDLTMEDTVQDHISLEEAKNLRLELMAERTTFMDTVGSKIDVYDLREHW